MEPIYPADKKSPAAIVTGEPIPTSNIILSSNSAALKALLSSTNLIVLHFCTFVRFVTTDHATCCCSKQSMMSGEMARSAANQSTFYAALGFR